MSDSFSVTTSQSWFGRLFESIKSVLFGGILFIVSFPLLFWNEGRAVRTARSLTEGLGAVVSVPVDAVAPGNEGKLVHVSGAVKTDKPVVDDELAIQADAVKLFRNVEMYQWKQSEHSETRKKLGGGSETVTTYDYKLEWAKGRIDSESFKKPEGHENPPAPAFDSKSFVADPVRVGAFTMSKEQIDKLGGAVDFPVEAGAEEKVSKEAAAKLSSQKDRMPLMAKDGKFYSGMYVNGAPAPKLGDLRISFQVIKPATVSLVGVQTAQSFAPFQAKAGDSILLVEDGTHTAAEMFKTAQEQNKVLTWILRVVFFFMMFLGLFLFFRPIAVFADVVPLVGTMLGAGIGLFAFLGAAVLSFITIAIAWVYVRPVLGITLLVIAGAGLFWLIKVGRDKKAARAAAAGAPAATTN
ncbi:MAG TPA: TMEM43 family protein [Thermoanaerobaculia bacterium]|nr:TMEM43 family protein [Thermoanaerobaculia bacterium]